MNLINTILRWLYFRILIRFVVSIILGLNVRHRERLPLKGPAIIAANHNSHLDTMVLITLLGKTLRHTHPVAAADYFLSNKLMAWFSTRIVGIIPIVRKRSGDENPLQPAVDALNENKIIIIFPEGTRGEPEKMQALKKGIAHLAKEQPQVPVIPIYLHGLGKALPKGEGLLVPFFCDVYIGEALHGQPDIDAFMQQLGGAFDRLREEAKPRPWD